MGEESGDVLGSVGLGPVAGAASRQVAKRLPGTVESQIAGALGGRILRRFGLRSVRLFGKAIPGLAGVVGAIADRRQLNKIARAAQEILDRKSTRLNSSHVTISYAVLCSK